MKHVIYHTEYYDRNEMFCLREEECDAYFNTIPEDSSALQETIPPIGCRLLLPKLVPSRLTKEQWEHLRIKKPDYELKYASLCDGENGEYSIYAIYEKWLGDEKDGEISEVFPVCVSFGENEDVALFLHAIPIDYALRFQKEGLTSYFSKYADKDMYIISDDVSSGFVLYYLG